MKHGVITHLAVLSCILAACACAPGGRAAKLASDPGLAADDLGIGLQLGASESAARELAAQLGEILDIEVLTREELNLRSPYEQRQTDRDMVIAVYSAEEADADGSSPLSAGSVGEIRCYLASAENSRIQLLGRAASQFDAASAVASFGEPFERTDSSDGQVHLKYYFGYAPDGESQSGGRSKWALELILSFLPTGKCYALQLGIADTPRT